MTQPLRDRRPEADVISLILFPFRRSVVAACAQNSAPERTHRQSGIGPHPSPTLPPLSWRELRLR